MEILPLFSTPLYLNNININLDVKEYIKQYNYIPRDKDGIVNSHSTLDNYILNDPALHTLKQTIEKEVNYFLKEQLKFTRHLNFYITTSWVVKHFKNHFSPGHRHSNSLFSGVVYLQVDENSGNIVFSSASNNVLPYQIAPGIEEYNIYNSTTWSITPRNNDIIIFPSHLAHHVTNNRSNNERYVLAFNVFISGKLCEGTVGELHLPG